MEQNTELRGRSYIIWTFDYKQDGYTVPDGPHEALGTQGLSVLSGARTATGLAAGPDHSTHSSVTWAM